jgi:hypothetical protein
LSLRGLKTEERRVKVDVAGGGLAVERHAPAVGEVAPNKRHADRRLFHANQLSDGLLPAKSVYQVPHAGCVHAPLLSRSVVLVNTPERYLRSCG